MFKQFEDAVKQGTSTCKTINSIPEYIGNDECMNYCCGSDQYCTRESGHDGLHAVVYSNGVYSVWDNDSRYE